MEPMNERSLQVRAALQTLSALLNLKLSIKVVPSFNRLGLYVGKHLVAVHIP